MLRPRFFCANAFSRTGYTFASPFAIAAGDMTKYFGAGAKVRQLSSTSVAGTVLTLNFTDATSIVAGQPYLVKPAANVDFSADGKEFAGVDLTAASAKPTTTDDVNFVPTLGKTEVTGSADEILFLGPNNTLFNPNAESSFMKGFRAYFQLTSSVSGAAPRAFVLDLGDDQATGIISLTLDPSPKGEGGIYTLDGRRINGEPTQKGVYIKNGKKVIIK